MVDILFSSLHSFLANVIIVVDQLQQWKQEGQGMYNGIEGLGVSEAVCYKKGYWIPPGCSHIH